MEPAARRGLHLGRRTGVAGARAADPQAQGRRAGGLRARPARPRSDLSRRAAGGRGSARVVMKDLETSRGTVRVVADPGEVALAAAVAFQAGAWAALKRKPRATVALAGGSTPKAM